MGAVALLCVFAGLLLIRALDRYGWLFERAKVCEVCFSKNSFADQLDIATFTTRTGLTDQSRGRLGENR